MNNFSTETNDVLYFLEDFSDKEFRAIFKIRSLCALLESKPTEKQICSIVNKRTYKNVISKLNRMNLLEKRVLYSPLIDIDIDYFESIQDNA